MELFWELFLGNPKLNGTPVSVFLKERLRKGCHSSIMNLRDMGAFQNPLNMHVNIGFYLSDPLGVKVLRNKQSNKLRGK